MAMQTKNLPPIIAFIPEYLQLKSPFYNSLIITEPAVPEISFQVLYPLELKKSQNQRRTAENMDFSRKLCLWAAGIVHQDKPNSGQQT